MRPYKKWLSVVAVLALVTIASACGGPSAGGLSGKSASQIIDLAQSAIANGGTFHFTDKSGSGKDAQVLTGYYSSESASQTLEGPDGELNVLSIGNTAYLRGGAAVLRML